ncbi:hypothetical protein HAX54_014678 [Datura stramonium]|uniref:Retrotransposon gag domain-containing protein n=1 Tax=Datura stramonium TaxID=4076 RepID=A0ABS8TNH5_DATST|nr:hypothetical protein [Datura stramonium]
MVFNLRSRLARSSENKITSVPKEKVDCSSKTEMGSKDETMLAQQLKMQFHGTRKGDLETIESYVNRLKSTADTLAAAIGNPACFMLREYEKSLLGQEKISTQSSPNLGAAAENNSNSNNSGKSTVEMIHDIEV